WLGALPELPVMLGGVRTSMTLAPFVYYTGTKPPPLTPNDEVAQAYWAPLEQLWDPRNGARLALTRDGASMEFPAIPSGENLVWGLTLRVLTLFADLIGRPLPV